MIRLILITAIAAGAAFLVLRLLSRRQSEGAQTDQTEGKQSEHRQRVGLLPILLVGIICTVLVVYVLPRFGISVMGLLQKLLALGPLIRAFLPF